MRLVRFAIEGRTAVGALTAQGRIAWLSRSAEAVGLTSPVLTDMSGANTVTALLESGESGLDRARSVLARVDKAEAEGKELKGAGETRTVFDRSEVRLLCPVSKSAKFIGIGMNYRDHAEEQGAKIPRAPMVFAKFSNSFIGPDDAIRFPRVTEQLDYEAELGVVIGRRGRDIGAEEAFNHVAGYCNVNDVTARDVQLSDRQWVRGKTLDDMTPIGPYLVTSDEVPNPGALTVSLWLNGKLLQDSNTDQLIFDIPTLISHVSQDITLEPGDLIATGTPSGVGFVREPPVFMQRGDVVAMEVGGLGRLENHVE